MCKPVSVFQQVLKCYTSVPFKFFYMNVKQKLWCNLCNHELKHLNWSTSSDPDCCFNNFYNKLNKLTNKHAPFKKLSKRKCRQFAKPWITKGLLTSIRKKNKLYLAGQQDEYKCYRNKLTTLIRLSKRNYYHHYFETNVNNMKQTWKGINSLIFNSRKKLKQIMACNCKIPWDPYWLWSILEKSHWSHLPKNQQDIRHFS